MVALFVSPGLIIGVAFSLSYRDVVLRRWGTEHMLPFVVPSWDHTKETMAYPEINLPRVLACAANETFLFHRFDGVVGLAMPR